MTKRVGFIEELKRRNVIRVGIAYLVGAWLLAQAADLVLDVMGAPDIILRSLVAVLVLGFVPAVIFAWAFELTPEGLKREKEVHRDASITHVTARKLDFVTIGMLAAVLVVVAVDRFLPGEMGSEPFSGDRTATATNSTGAEKGSDPISKSIAVLPFVNMSSDPEQEYFSDGISEEILNALAKVKDLKVAGRTSSFAFKGENQDLRQVGETLGVEHILEGSVRKSGTKVRITAQLIQVDDGFHLWSESYDRELDDVFAIQDEIAGAILEQLKAHLLADEQKAMVSARTDSAAYDLYLLAKQRIYERSKSTLDAAAGFLDQAVAIDPEYAPAYAQRGITAVLLSEEDYGTTPVKQALAQAKLYIDQALRLNPQDPEALAALGLYYNNIPGKAPEAIEALEKSLAINPNMVDAANWLQGAYGAAGRLDEALATLEDLVERDPLYRPGLGNIMGWYGALNRIDDGKALIERVRPSMPNDPFLFRMEAQLLYAGGEHAIGLKLAERALELQPDNYPNQSLVADGLLNTGQFERAATLGQPWQRIYALKALGRMEESRLLAFEQASSGKDVGTYISLLANSGQQAEVIKFIEDRWADLEAFELEFPALGSGGPGTMLDVAYAYASIGNTDRFDDAMRRSRQTLDRLEKLGGDNYFLYLLEAAYANLSGDPATALSYLDRAVERGAVFAASFADAWATFKTLEGDPEYEAIQQRMFDHMNEERKELGLEPMVI